MPVAPPSDSERHVCRVRRSEARRLQARRINSGLEPKRNPAEQFRFGCNFIHIFLIHFKYSGTSLLRSSMGLDKSDLNGEVTVLQGANLQGGIQFGTEQW